VIDESRRLAKPRIRRIKNQYPNTKSLFDLKDLIPTRTLVALVILVALAFFQWVAVIPPAYAPTTSINIQNFAFNPLNVTIQAGDSVIWTNNDPVIYTLWFTDANNGSTYLLSPPINPGTTWTHVFPDKIRLNYYDFDRLYITAQLMIVPILGGDFWAASSIGQSVTYSTTASGGTAPYKFSWAFGDGTVGTGSGPTHTYQSLGPFTVALTITDSSTPNAFAVTVTHLVILSSIGGGGGTRPPLRR
jgi:plastocyanin